MVSGDLQQFDLQHTYVADVVSLAIDGPSPYSYQHVLTLLLTWACCCSAGSLSLLPPGASPHAIAGLLKRFLLGLPEPLLTYRCARAHCHVHTACAQCPWHA
jgi:hypothetical protein